MAYSTVCQSKRKPIVEPPWAKPKTYRQAPAHLLKFYEEAVSESEARVIESETNVCIILYKLYIRPEKATTHHNT